MVDHKNRLKFAIFLFGSAGMIGPIFFAVGLDRAIVSPLWPTSILGVYEYSFGRTAAFIITIISNILLFGTVGIISSLPKTLATFSGTCFGLLLVIGSLCWYRYGSDLLSYVVLLSVVACLFYLQWQLTQRKSAQAINHE